VLTVARDSGEFSFIGGSGARFDGPLTATGLSADAQIEESDGDSAVFSGMECV